MFTEKIIIYICLICLCIWFIFSELKSYGKKDYGDEFTNSKIKIERIYSVVCAIVLVLVFLYFIYKDL